jgi:hypothetical protein
MNKKLLVLLIAVIPVLMPNLASAIEIEIDEGELTKYLDYTNRDDCEGYIICDSN